MSRQRVAERVDHGGHDIPLEAIIRRYPRSFRNLLKHYAPLCDTTICLDNSSATPEMIFFPDLGERHIVNPTLFKKLANAYHD